MARCDARGPRQGQEPRALPGRAHRGAGSARREGQERARAFPGPSRRLASRLPRTPRRAARFPCGAALELARAATPQAPPLRPGGLASPRPAGEAKARLGGRGRGRAPGRHTRADSGQRVPEPARVRLSRRGSRLLSSGAAESRGPALESASGERPDGPALTDGGEPPRWPSRRGRFVCKADRSPRPRGKGEAAARAQSGRARLPHLAPSAGARTLPRRLGGVPGGPSASLQALSSLRGRASAGRAGPGSPLRRAAPGRARRRAGAEGAARSRHCLPRPPADPGRSPRLRFPQEPAELPGERPFPRLTASACRVRLPPAAPFPSAAGPRTVPASERGGRGGSSLRAGKGIGGAASETAAGPALRSSCRPRCPPRSEAASLSFPEPPARPPGRLPAWESLASEAPAGLAASEAAALSSPFAPLPYLTPDPRLKAAERAGERASERLEKGCLSRTDPSPRISIFFLLFDDQPQ
ncbi:translation initiation factor IF-2-like [Crotalus tigris]|uniref:translation initiation factor IF-2-like n=1 Tax=Crotalus tigris TaxID=88082 RepID=UPI00192F8D40|nr:translation initiation factor IF-2-like [Crotalus tigris]